MGFLGTELGREIGSSMGKYVGKRFFLNKDSGERVGRVVRKLLVRMCLLKNM